MKRPLSALRSLPGLVTGPAIVFCALILLFLIGEAVTRYFGGVRYGGWGDPSSVHLVRRQLVVNARGLRGPLVPYRHGSYETRILCLGDSFTWGQMVDAEDAWPAVMERGLAARNTGPKAVVVNAGQLGWNTAREYEWLAAEGIRYEPDVIVVGFFLNDAEATHFSIGSLLPRPMESLFSRSYFYFFLRYRMHMLKVRFGLTPGYVEYIRGLYDPGQFEWKKCKRALRLMHETADERGARFVVVILPLITDWDSYPLQEVHEEVFGFCRSRGISVVDALPAFQSSSETWQVLRIGPADRHPSVAGHKIIANVVLDEVLGPVLATGP